MKSYVVLFHEEPTQLIGMSPSEMQAVIARYSAWFAQLRACGRVEVGKKLKDEGGRHLRRVQGAVVASDGPYAEAKDVVSGLFVIEAGSYDEARSLLADCPHFDFGWVEVREIDVVD